MPPLVSVLIDTYNHERFIEQAIQSVLQQDLSPSDMEILVVDDGSTDHTPEIVPKFAPRVRYLRKPNGGQASAFNVGIPETRGEIVAMLDGDDWWAPHKLRRQLETLAANPEIGIVGHGYIEADADGRTYAAVLPGTSGRFDLTTPAAAQQFSMVRGCFGTTKMAIRRRVVERILPVPEDLVIEADEYIFMLAPALAPAYLLNEALFYYRFHGGNLFQAYRTDERGKRRKCQVLSSLTIRLPPRLAEFGIPVEVSDALLLPLRLDAARARLTLDGGSRWEAFQVERGLYSLGYRRMSVGYHAFRAVALSLALLLPPRWFYRFRQWYTDSGLSRVRALVARATPAQPVAQVRPGGSS